MKERAFQNYKRLTQEQLPRVRRLVKQCCNFDHGECIALDDGAGCVCVQTISYSPLCRWSGMRCCPWTRCWSCGCWAGFQALEESGRFGAETEEGMQKTTTKSVKLRRI